MKKISRCSWCDGSELYERYHDEEWGKPLHDEKKHFEFLLLETMQTGLSWITILKRREHYRKAFANFNPKYIAKFDEKKVEELMQNEGIIRNRKKIESAINNAQRFLEIQKEFGSFDQFIWSFTNGKIIKNNWKSVDQMQATSPLSDEVAKVLKKRGFKFVGSTIVYAHLQAIGVINDHVMDCFLFK